MERREKSAVYEWAKSTDREAIWEALTKTRLAKHFLPQGPIVFGPDGQNQTPGFVLTQILGGERKVVFPKEYVEAKPVSPIPD